MRRALTIALAFFAAIGLVTLGLTYNQVSHQRQQLESNLQYRSSLLAGGLREAVEPNFTDKSDSYLQSLVERYSNKQRIAGLAVVNSNDGIVAVSSSLPRQDSDAQQLAANVMDADTPDGEFVEINNAPFYVYAMPLHSTQKGKASVVGALLVVQNASYINDQLDGIWKANLTRMFIQAFVFLLAAVVVWRWVVVMPLQRMTESLRATRLANASSSPAIISGHPLLRPIMSEVTWLQQSLAQAQKTINETGNTTLEKIDEPWTESRLRDYSKDILKGRTLLAVSSLEPYVHTKQNSKIGWHVPASGLLTAIEPVMQAMGGIWVALGNGDADKLVVDEHDKVLVPPNNPKYTLKRVWLTSTEKEGFLDGFSNQAMYPLCHMAHVRPQFRKEDWKQYQKVNAKFARAILREIRQLENPVVFIQDFQFTLVPRLIKRERPDAMIGLFWHIPWVNAEAFSICPWRREILDGMLGADLLGFHTQQHCNNFIDTVGHELEALIDYERFSVTRGQHVSLIRPFPVSVAFDGNEPTMPKPELSELRTRLLRQLNVSSEYIGFGVDRFDFIKGLAERFTAIDILMERNPSLRGKFTFIQISAPPEGKDKLSQDKFHEYEQQIDTQVNRINAKYRTRHWQPIVFLKRRHEHAEIAEYYKIANFCLVSSLHDGMNLVAKEYVASRSDERGVLILSQFAGASKELTEALVVNPYDAAQTAQAMRTALSMPAVEQTKRMRKMRAVVKNYNIYRWSAEFLKTIAELE
jgi:trehalose-6-phosphate synthase